MPNPERLRVRLDLPEPLAETAWAALVRAVPEARVEKGNTRSLTVMQVRPALYALAEALA
jgi:hypothetical protein